MYSSKTEDSRLFKTSSTGGVGGAVCCVPWDSIDMVERTNIFLLFPDFYFISLHLSASSIWTQVCTRCTQKYRHVFFFFFLLLFCFVDFIRHTSAAVR